MLTEARTIYPVSACRLGTVQGLVRPVKQGRNGIARMSLGHAKAGRYLPNCRKTVRSQGVAERKG